VWVFQKMALFSMEINWTFIILNAVITWISWGVVAPEAILISPRWGLNKLFLFIKKSSLFPS
jgi:hypothetical protein